MLLWLEGFETFKADDWLALRYTQSGVASTATGRMGGTAMSGQAAGTTLTRTVLDTAGDVLVVGLAIKVLDPITASAKPGVTLALAGSDQITLQVIASGEHEWKLELRRGGTSGTVIATQSGTAQFVGKWHYVELKATVDPTVGTYDVEVDGVSVLSGTGEDTAGAGVANVDQVVLRMTNEAAFDDVYVCDDSGTANNDFLGSIAVEGLRPNANGNQNDWTPQSGANYTNVDEDGLLTLGTDYVSADTVGQVDLFGFQSMQRAAGSPTFIGVVVASVLAMQASGSQNVAVRTRSGASEAAESPHAISGGAQQHVHDVLEENPVSSLPWSVTDVNAVEFGVEVTA